MKKQVEKFGKKVLFTSRVIVASFAQGGESGQIFYQRFDKKTVLLKGSRLYLIVLCIFIFCDIFLRSKMW